VSKVARDSLVLSLLNAAGLVANVVLFAVIAALFGANRQTDAFFIALTVPALFIGPVVNPIAQAFLPVLIESRVRRPEAFGKVVGSALANVALFSVLAVGAAALATPGLLKLAAGDLPTDVQHLVLRQTLLLLPIVVTQSLFAVMSAAHNAAGRFSLPAALTAFRPIVTLALIPLLRPSLGADSLPVSFVAGTLAQLAVLAPAWKRVHTPVVWTLKIDPEFRRSLRLAVPLIVGTVTLQFSLIATRFLAARLEAGSVTVLDYASRVSQAFTDVMTSGVFLVTLASWSEVVARGNVNELGARLQRTMLTVLFVVLPGLAVLLAMPESAVAAVLQRGRFDERLTALTSATLVFFLIGVPLDVVGQCYVRLFLARQDTWIVGTTGVLRLLATVSLALVLIGPLQVRGLALANSIAIGVVVIAFVLRARSEVGSTQGLGSPFFKLGLLGLSAFGIAQGARLALASAAPWLQLAGASVAVVLVYVAVARLLNMPELGVARSVVVAWTRRRAAGDR
jgi:putative peptidoglycan lipid II flippase